MKKIVAILISLTMVLLTFSGCGGQGETSGDLLQKIREKGVISIAMEGTWEPWTYHNENDELVGFDTEVGKLLAEELGVKAEFTEGEWDGLFAGLSSGRYDIIINGVEVTEERRKKYDFTDPYAYIKTALIVKSDNETIHTFENLNGKETCNSTNSTYMNLAESYGAHVTGVDSLEETLNMVLAGRVEATLNAEVSFYDYMRVHPDAELKVAALTEEASDVCIPMRKGDETKTLREAINKALQKLRDNGKLKELSDKYFGKDITEK